MFVTPFANPAYGFESRSVRVAIIDTGISTTVIDAKNIDTGHNYILPYTSTEDTIGHGTAVAAIIAGSQLAGITGLCPETVLVPMIYYSKEGESTAYKGNLDMLAQMIRDAVDIYHCRIINISSGAMSDSAALRDAVAWAEQKGVLVISCSGNDGDETAYYPGAFPSVLCVGTVNLTANGPAYFSNRHKDVDLLAPGYMIESSNLNGETVKVNGTSFSTAWVSGAAAALLTKEPTLTPYQLRQILCNTATDICSEGYDIYSGWGVVDLNAAFDQLKKESEVALQFSDVKDDTHYLNAVKWAIKNGITSGTTSSTFSPDMTCTRAQTLTFLWRSMGYPEPRITENPFVDVAETDYFFKAVLWSVESGITSGKSDTEFSPYATCNEAQIITFLWRALNRPNALGRSELASGLGEYYYTDAIAWADINGLFAAAQTDFVPLEEATRSNIIIYLYHSIGINH